MNRRTFLATLGSIISLPSVAFGLEATPTFAEAKRYFFHKQLSLCVKEHLPAYPVFDEILAQNYFANGVGNFMKAARDRGDILESRIIVLGDDGNSFDAEVKFILKQSPYQEETLKVALTFVPHQLDMKFFTEKV